MDAALWIFHSRVGGEVSHICFADVGRLRVSVLGAAAFARCQGRGEPSGYLPRSHSTVHFPRLTPLRGSQAGSAADIRGPW